MLHNVTVYFSNEDVFKKVPTAMGHHFRLTEDVKTWLAENTNENGWGDSPLQEVTTGDYIGVTFQFIDPNHATLFKLTWGGGKL